MLIASEKFDQEVGAKRRFLVGTQWQAGFIAAEPEAERIRIVAFDHRPTLVLSDDGSSHCLRDILLGREESREPSKSCGRGRNGNGGAHDRSQSGANKDAGVYQ